MAGRNVEAVADDEDIVLGNAADAAAVARAGSRRSSAADLIGVCMDACIAACIEACNGTSGEVVDVSAAEVGRALVESLEAGFFNLRWSNTSSAHFLL